MIDASRADRVAAWADRSLRPDDHGDPALDGAYRTSTLYLDTAALDVLHRSPGFRRSRFRLRRYGEEEVVHLERKRRRRDRVTKVRNAVAAAECARLAEAPRRAHNGAAGNAPGGGADDWPGSWFHASIAERGLRPSARIAYLRRAWVGSEGAVPLRMTLDRELSGAATSEWRLPSCGEAADPPLCPGVAVLELKFVEALPDCFKRLLAECPLTPRALSKYRLCRGGAATVLAEATRA